MTCAYCRRHFDRTHSWLRVDRGQLVDGDPAPRDLDYCCPDHAAADLAAAP